MYFTYLCSVVNKISKLLVYFYQLVYEFIRIPECYHHMTTASVTIMLQI